MKNKIILVVLAVLLVFVSYALGRAVKTKEDLAEKASMESMHMNSTSTMPVMDMSKKEPVAGNRYAPTVNLTAIKDKDGGYNLHILTNNFYFTPADVGKDAVQNTGHAHVYVNDIKIGRAYNEWYYISDKNLQSGTNTVSVTLNANNHNVWWSKNGTKEAKATIDLVK